MISKPRGSFAWWSLVGAVLLTLGVAQRSEAQDAQSHLWDAARAGDTVAMSKALAEGAGVDSLDTRRSPNGRRALNWAALGNQPGAIRFLVAHGATIDAANLTGFTALHHAAEAGSVDAAKTLLELGAKKTLLNANGETAQAVATRTSHLEVAMAIAGSGKTE
jgi:ankyrin repeat protein